MRKMLVVVLLWTSTAAYPEEFQHLQAMRNISYEKVRAQEIDRDFHIYTMRPDSYATEPDRQYPTIYLLDGGALMPLLSGYYRYLRLSEEIDEAMIVAISYGARDFPSGNFRSTDYTAPSDEREWYGGAERFQSFLEQELIPRIEKNHRSDSSRRIIFGQSIGGQFVLFTAQTKPELFWGHIASNPALHRNVEFYLDTVPEHSSGSKLFVASATNDEPRFRVPALKWIETWSERKSHPFELRVEHLQGHTHASAPPVAFRNGLTWLFAEGSDGSAAP